MNEENEKRPVDKVILTINRLELGHVRIDVQAPNANAIELVDCAMTILKTIINQVDGGDQLVYEVLEQFSLEQALERTDVKSYIKKSKLKILRLQMKPNDIHRLFVTNMPPNGAINSIEAAVTNWYLRTEEHTIESFCKYVMDKSDEYNNGQIIYSAEEFLKTYFDWGQ